MTNVAGIGNLVGVRLRRRNEAEGVGVDIHVRNRLLDLWHVAGDALAACAARLVMRVFLDGGRMRPILRVRPVTREAHFTGRLTQLRRVLGPVHVVATEAGHAASIHQALGEIVALHAVLMGRRVPEVGEGGLAEPMLLQSPEIGKV